MTHKKICSHYMERTLQAFTFVFKILEKSSIAQKKRLDLTFLGGKFQEFSLELARLKIYQTKTLLNEEIQRFCPPVPKESHWAVCIVSMTLEMAFKPPII